jgi:putative ABC transport system permease protein
VNDLRFAFRQLLKNPGFTAVAVLTLALGIGATTTIFTVIDGVLLRPLSYPGSERMVHVWERNREQGIDEANTSPDSFADWRKECQAFEALAFHGESPTPNLDAHWDHEPGRSTGVRAAAQHDRIAF